MCPPTRTASSSSSRSIDLRSGSRRPRVAEPDEQRRGRDRDDDGRQDRRIQLARDHLAGDPDGGEDKAELADLAQAGRDLSRAARKAPEPGKKIDRGNLGYHEQREYEAQPPQSLEQRTGIDQRADRDEEEHREHIAKWQQPLPRLRRFAALADGQPRDEGGQGKRHAEEARAQPGEREGTRDRDDEEEVVFLAKLPEQSRKESGGDHHDDRVEQQQLDGDDP